MPDPRPLIEYLVAALNAHEPAAARSLFADTYVGIDQSRASRCEGADQAVEEMRGWLRAFPDLHLQPYEIVVEGDRVAFAWHLTGTHQAVFLNIPPTGRRLTVSGFTLLTVADGRFVWGRSLWDAAGMLRGMKLLPELHPTLPLSTS